MSDPAPTSYPLEQRLLLSFKDLVQTPIADESMAAVEAAREILAGMAFHERVENTVTTPDATSPKPANLVVKVTDNGRTKVYAPIRTLKIELEIRANSLTPAGQAEPFLSLCGAMEAFLDGLDLAASLTSSGRAVAVMLATRSPGIAQRVSGDLRHESYVLDVRAVATEHTQS